MGKIFDHRFYHLGFTTFYFFSKRYPTEIPELVHKEGFLGQTGVSTGSFLIDSTLGRDTQFGIYVEDEEDHLIKSIRFTDSKGKTYGPFHRMSSDFDLINFKTINFPAGQSPPFSAVSFTFCKIFLHPFNAPWYVFLQLV